MKPGFIYRFISQAFHETDDIQVWVDIEDMDNMVADDVDQTIYGPTPTGEPIGFSGTDNDEDPFKVIRSQKLTIKFHSSTDINSSTFATGTDGRWKVKAYIDEDATRIWFTGFLIMTGMTQPFMPHPNEVTLVATDNLGSLKEIPLTDFDDVNPTGYQTLSTFLAWALSKTGLSLDLVVAFNFKHGSGLIVEPTGGVNFHGSPDEIRIVDTYEFFPYVGQRIVVSGSPSNDGTFTVTAVTTSTGTTFISVAEAIVGEFPLTGVTLTDESSQLHLFQTIYLQSRTWEDEIGTSINCYDVIERILYGASLFQRQGKWVIVRLDERQEGGLYFETFNSSGVSALDLTLKTVNKDIGKDAYSIFFSLEQTEVLYDRPRKSIRLDYDYILPSELICNIDFSRGTRNPGLDGTGYEAYDLECWESKKANYPTSDLIAAATDIYMKKVLEGGFEKERYVVIAASTPPNNLIYSEAFPMHIRDKFSFTLGQRLSGDPAGSGEFTFIMAQVRLYGDDGTFWTLERPGNTTYNPAWYACDSAFTTNQKTIEYVMEVADDQTESISLTVEAPGLPVSGSIRFLLYQNNHGGSGGVYDTYIEIPQIEYIPFINGSYHEFSGQYHKVTGDDYRAKIEDTVYMSDSPKKIFNGAMHVLSGGAYVLATKFYNAAVFPNGVPDGTYIHPYGEIQVFDVWNQFNREMRIFYATMQGIDAGEVDGAFLPNHASLVHRYVFQDVTIDTLNRSFFCLSLDQNWRNQEATATFRETHSTDETKLYLGHEFKYKE